MTEQKYCVVATDRIDGKRKMITGPMTEADAYDASAGIQRLSFKRKEYKYFKVAKYPYKTR